jgi:hypothetical protein
LKEATLCPFVQQSHFLLSFSAALTLQVRNGSRLPGYTEYHKTKAEVWDEAFAEPQLVLWLALQKRGASAAPE